MHIVGGGLAGSEAAWQLAEAGVKVRLSEMRGTHAPLGSQRDLSRQYRPATSRGLSSVERLGSPWVGARNQWAR